MAVLNVNGTLVRSVGPDTTPLLWVLREQLGLGAEYGCGVGMCGACTVHVDGAPTRACVTAVGRLGGRKITTVDRLAPAIGG